MEIVYKCAVYKIWKRWFENKRRTKQIRASTFSGDIEKWVAELQESHKQNLNLDEVILLNVFDVRNLKNIFDIERTIQILKSKTDQDVCWKICICSDGKKGFNLLIKNWLTEKFITEQEKRNDSIIYQNQFTLNEQGKSKIQSFNISVQNFRSHLVEPEYPLKVKRYLL